MNKLRRIIVLAVISGGLSILLTACALRSLFGNVIIVEDIANEVSEIITTVFSDSTAAVCLDTDYGFYECTYIVDGDIDDTVASLKKISKMGLENVVPGHGDIVLRGEIDGVVKENLAYLSALRKAVRPNVPARRLCRPP